MGTADKKFSPGDLVQIRHDVPWRRMMVVREVSFTKYLSEGEIPPRLSGVRCFWMTDSGEYQERSFDTRDLEHCKRK